MRWKLVRFEMSRSESLNREARARTRAKILRSAIALFGKAGFSATTIAEISRDAGVAKGLVNYHFGSKEELLEAVVDHSYMVPVSGDVATVSDDAQLAAIIDDALLTIGSSIPLWRVTLATKLEPATLRLFEASEARHAATLNTANDVRRALFARRGASDPGMENTMLHTILEGIAVKRAVYGKSYPLEAARRWIFTLYGLPAPTTALASEDSESRDRQLNF